MSAEKLSARIAPHQYGIAGIRPAMFHPPSRQTASAAKHSAAAADFLCRVSTFKLRSQFLRAAELCGNFFFCAYPSASKSKMLFVFFNYIGGIRHVSLVQLRSQPRHKFMLFVIVLILQ